MKGLGVPKRAPKISDWQVVYIDMLSQITIFFIILWTLSQAQQKGLSDTQGTETARMISLPGDVIFSPGKDILTSEGRNVFNKLFNDETGSILSFETSGLEKRMLVVHGHTDGDGKKDDNFSLGYRRAFAAYKEIRRYSKEVPDHVIVCSHSDNTPEQEVPAFRGNLTDAQKTLLKGAKAKNRRITIEDKMVNVFKEGD